MCVCVCVCESYHQTNESAVFNVCGACEHSGDWVPVVRGSGERGLERVGEGVPTARLLLLLLRQLWRTKRRD